MRLTTTETGIIWEHDTSARRPVRILLNFDCKEPMTVSSIETCADAIRENKADCSLIVHLGLKSRDIIERIQKEEKRIGKEGILSTLALTRRDFDLLLLINRVKDELRKKDRSKVEVEKLEREVKNLWRRFYGGVERIVRNFYDKGYIVPIYALHEEDPSILLSLSLTQGDESTAYHEYVKFFFPLESSVPILDITRAKERVKEKQLVNGDWKINLPAFLHSILADLTEGRRKITDISRKFMIVDEVDLRKWLAFLASLSIVRPSSDYWLLRSHTDLNKELEQKRVKDPKGMNRQDKYGGTLANFLAGFGYDKLKAKLEEIKEKFKENPSFAEGDLLGLIRNVTVYHAIYVKGYERLQAVIAKATNEMERSRSELNTANDEIKDAKKSLRELNKELDKLAFWRIV